MILSLEYCVISLYMSSKERNHATHVISVTVAAILYVNSYIRTRGSLVYKCTQKYGAHKCTIVHGLCKLFFVLND